MSVFSRPRHCRGIVSVMAIVLLSVFLALAATFAAMTDTNSQVSKNLADVQRARLAAESGLAFGARLIRGVRLPPATRPEEMIATVSQALADVLNGTANLDGAAMTSNATTIDVPRIQTEDGAFDVRIIRSPEGTLVLQVHGVSNEVVRSVAVDLMTVAKPPNSAFNYGIASQGPIILGGTAEIRGQNDMAEASVISTAAGAAVIVGGTAVVEGDLFSAGPESSVVITGTPTIAGSQDPAVIAQHVHFGVEPPVFPVADTSIFRPLATTVIDGTTNTSTHGAVFNNVVIKAGTNPTFSSDVTLNGVVYIEAPNVVTFSAKVTLNGLIATDDSDEPLSACKVTFGGQVEAYGVEALPDTGEFQEVKALTGTFIVAPGFDIRFAGQFTTINGTIAADKLCFSGQAEGTVKGSVIGLSHENITIDGTVSINVDRGGDDGQDAGFVMPIVLDVEPRTYREIAPAGSS